MHHLQSSIESLIGSSVEYLQAQNNLAVLEAFLHALNVGEIRAATCDESGTCSSMGEAGNIDVV